MKGRVKKLQSIFKAEVKKIGEQAHDMIEKNIIILFEENAPAELEEISVIHRKEYFTDNIKTGDKFKIDDEVFEILSVGDAANENLDNIGHCSLKFNGKNEAELPGDVSLEIATPPEIKTGTLLEVIRE